MKTEKVLSIIFIISLLIKLMHWPGGSAIMILSLLGLALCYFPLGFYFLNEKNVFKQKLGISIVFGWLLSVAIIGILFKLMFWPGSGPMLIIGFLTALIFSIIAFFMFKNALTGETKHFHKNLLLRSLILFVLSFICYLLPNEVLINHYYSQEPILKDLYLKQIQNPNDKEIQKEIDIYRAQQFKNEIK